MFTESTAVHAGLLGLCQPGQRTFHIKEDNSVHLHLCPVQILKREDIICYFSFTPSYIMQDRVKAVC